MVSPRESTPTCCVHPRQRYTKAAGAKSKVDFLQNSGVRVDREKEPNKHRKPPYPQKHWMSIIEQIRNEPDGPWMFAVTEAGGLRRVPLE